MTDERSVVPGTEKPLKSGSTRVAEVDPGTMMDVTLTVRGPDLPSADDITDTRLDPDEFAARYGAAPSDLDTVESVMREHGLTVVASSPETRTVRVQGPASDVRTTFDVDLGIYRRTSRGTTEEYRGQEGEVKVPTELAGIVTGVFGLDQRRVARRRTAVAIPTQGSGTKGSMTPQELERLYDFPAGDASGQRVAIGEFGGMVLPGDLRRFCHDHGLPDASTSLQTVAIDGAPVPTIPELQAMSLDERNAVLGATVEVMMDIEIVAGLAPGAEIVVYFAPITQQGWVDLFARAVQDRPVSLSISWGSAEDSPQLFSPAGRAAINHQLAALAVLGVTVCVASGDDGSGDGVGDDRCHADFPASSPFVLGVGGTELGAGEEVTWFDAPGTRFAPDGQRSGGGASGGGVSRVFRRPSWQAVTVPRAADGGSDLDGRVVPDVAALAGAPMYDLVLLGSPQPNGGTSASAPLWAALIARAQATLPTGTAPRFLTPLLYDGDVGATACRDVSSGHNISSPAPGVGYRAAGGYDAVTGWGVPIGSRIVALLAGAP